ncbi:MULTISPECIES: autophagy-related protein 27 [unclassified Exiguobacterium]|uniref:autophagy-related protein 27 n=1 Tax=unclassified Exiguobacterium TaxID=2644629 RepID=UPI0020367009|nr:MULTISPECIES: autophagy-related protein 27 [unclassified Exiguobacterium]
MWSTIIDSIFLKQSIPFIIWFTLHFIFIAIAILLYLLFVSYLNRWFIQWILPRPWAFRQVFPYTVAANVWTFPIGVFLYQFGYQTSGVTFIIIGHVIYSLTPLLLVRLKKKTSRPSS